MKSQINLFLIFLSLALVSCCKEETSECRDDLVCTEIFVSIGVKVKNTNNQDVTLLKTTTEIQGTNIILTKTDLNPFYGSYTILDDLSKSDLKKSGSIVTFKGYDSKNKLVFSEIYTIGHDCCHVVKLNGKEIIIVN